MSRKRKETLSDDDRILWNLVARSTKPLKGRRIAEDPEFAAAVTAALPVPAPISQQPAPVPPSSPKRQNVGRSLDVPTLDKLSKGKTPIEGRVDLHGMTQAEAHSLLLSFLSRAHVNGMRYVLVITGKGSSSGGDGVLRRAVPEWLATPPFRILVSSHDGAARHHGGGGAIYVRLRRRT